MSRKYLKPISLDKIPNLHTKQLLQYLKVVRWGMTDEWFWNNCLDPESNEAIAKKEKTEVYLLALKKELATREHIPNGREAKKIRQEKAKNRKSR